ERFDDGVVVGNIDDLNFLNPETHDLANSRKCERFKSSGNGHFAVTDFRRQDFGRERLFVEFLAQLQILDVVKEFDDVLVGAVAKGSTERRRQDFATRFATIESDAKMIGGSDWDFR